MTRILAFVDASPSSVGVIRTAEALGELLGAAVDIATVVEPRQPSPPEAPRTRLIHGDVATALLGELRAHDVICGVLGSRSVHAKEEVAGHIATAVLAASPVPLTLIPPNGRSLPPRPRFLVPLDGTAETTLAVRPVCNDLADAGADILFLHVFDSDSIPPFLDSSHDLEVLAHDFLLEHVPERPGRCELRLGDPQHHIVDLVEGEAIDAVILAWRQDFSPGRADVIRQLIREGTIPLLVVPMTTL